MNSTNFNSINISKADYFALPATIRAQTEDGPWILVKRGGRETFVRANIIEPRGW